MDFFALGAMLNFTIIYLLFERFNFSEVSWSGLFFQALAFIGLTLTSSIYIATIFIFIIGIFNGASQSLFQTQLHTSFDETMKGKISSLRDAMVAFSNLIMIPVFSRLLNFNLYIAFWIFALCILASSISVFLIFRLKML